MSEVKEKKLSGDTPKITVELRKAHHISEIPFADLSKTLVLTDYNDTIQSTSLKMMSPPTLRGGEKAYQVMKDLHDKAWGYYILTAYGDGPEISVTSFDLFAKGLDRVTIAPEKTTSESKDAEGVRKAELQSLFLPERARGKASKVVSEKHTLFNSESGKEETTKSGIISENVSMFGFDKFHGAIVAIQNSKKSDKIENIVIIDDFVPNPTLFANDLLKYLNEHNLKDRISDHLKITCVWLDPTLEIQAGRMKKPKDDSYSADCDLLRMLYPENPGAETHTLEEYQEILSDPKAAREKAQRSKP
jgi:hypothetical protein